MPTTKDRTPAAWRSQVPPRVRPLAAVAADLGGEKWEPRAKPADHTGRGPIRRHGGLTEAAVLETIHRSQTVPTLSDTR